MPSITIPKLPKRYKLQVQLIPKSSWFKNLRNVLPREEWDKLRKETYAAYGYYCAACRTKGKLHAHEVWKFDLRTMKQTLVKLVALCELCHSFEHFGFTSTRETQYVTRVIKHAGRVLKRKRPALRKMVEKALEVHQQRSLNDWTIDFGPYAKLVKEEKNEAT